MVSIKGVIIVTFTLCCIAGAQEDCFTVKAAFEESMANNDYSSRWRFHGYYASNSYYIPQCSSDGTFLPIQCSTPNDTLYDKQYCWCVDPATGIAVQSNYDTFDDDYLYYSEIVFPPEVISNVTCENVNTTAICEDRYDYRLQNFTYCAFLQCDPGPADVLELAVDCFFLECGYNQVYVSTTSDPCSCDYECVDQPGPHLKSVNLAFALGLSLSLFAFILILVVATVVAICCVVKSKSLRRQSPTVAMATMGDSNKAAIYIQSPPPHYSESKSDKEMEERLLNVPV